MTEVQKVEVRRLLSSLALFIEFHHGDCIGADAEAHEIAKKLGHVIHIYPSTARTRAFCEGADVMHLPKPPLDRNRDIVDAVEILLATPKLITEELRSGTWAAIRYARRIKRSIIMVYP